MATYNIANTDRDGHSEGTDEQVNPSTATYGTFYLGMFDAGHELDGAWIWVTTIPQGSTINTAAVTLNNGDNDNSGTASGAWWGFDVDAIADFDAGHVHRISDHATRTTATVADNISGTANHTSPSLVSILQEIVNRPSFGGRIGLTHRSTASAWNYWEFRDYSDAAGDAATLDVTWTPPGQPAILRTQGIPTGAGSRNRPGGWN